MSVLASIMYAMQIANCSMACGLVLLSFDAETGRNAVVCTPNVGRVAPNVNHAAAPIIHFSCHVNALPPQRRRICTADRVRTSCRGQHYVRFRIVRQRSSRGTSVERRVECTDLHF